MLAFIRSLFARLFAGKGRSPACLAEELQCHLEMEIEENRRRGLPPGEARRRALVALGGFQQATEAYRETWGLRWLGELGQDLRYSLRGMARNPGFTFLLVTVLALGISASSLMFSVVDRLLLNPLPFANASRMVYFPRLGGPQEALEYWGRQNHAFEKVALYSGGAVGLSASGPSERIQVARATADLFSILSAAPLLGRTFSQEEGLAGKDQVVILSYGFWKRTGGSRDVLGHELRLNNASHEVIGVMPPESRFPPQTEVWVPMAFGAARRALEFDVDPSRRR